VERVAAQEFVGALADPAARCRGSSDEATELATGFLTRPGGLKSVSIS